MKRDFQSLDWLVLSCLFVTAELRTVLVKDLDCYITTSKHTHCSWVVDSNAQDLRAFYCLLKEDGSISIFDNLPPPSFQECPSYSSSNSSRTGCDLQAAPTDDILVFFNGTLDGTVVTTEHFRKEIKWRPPRLNWTVTKARDMLNISWIPPDLAPLHRWNFIIDYAECNKPKQQLIVQQVTSHRLIRISSCSYSIHIKAQEANGDAETPSSVKLVDAEPDPNVAMYAIVIIVPLMLAGLTALTIVCCRKNKELIFPEIPKPLDLLSDISENNNKCIAHNLYVVAEKEDSCKIITLVIDPQTNKPASWLSY